MYDVAIIGAGPAGLAAAIYGKRAGLDVLVLDASPLSGGQILNTYEIDNYPGLPGMTGTGLAENFKNHALKLGAEFATGRVKTIEKKESNFELTTRKGNFEAKAVILATGASNKKLGCPGEEELSGMGVSYCATCDGAFFAGKTVAVVGGGDVALEDALYLARGCEKVYLLVRRDEFRGAAILQEQVLKTANIEVMFNTTVESINGDSCVASATVKNKIDSSVSSINIDGIFIAVGTTPNTANIDGLPNCDEQGYIIASEDCVTSIPGLFAAGDLRTKQLRQVVTATADGANAITSVEKYFQGL